MKAIHIQPMQWEHIPDISEMSILETDAQCFREIRDVLKKYDALDRFGLTLIHSHFEIGEDELMMELTDAANRTHTVKPIPMTEIDEKELTITHWKFTDDESVVAKGCACARRPDSHLGYHRPT